MKKFMIYLIYDQVTNRPLYVGRGRTRYGDGKRKGWSRIDIHKKELDRTRRVKAGEISGYVNSLYLKFLDLIDAGVVLGYRVVKEVDDPYEAVIEEGRLIESIKAQNQLDSLLNVQDVAGNGLKRNRVKRVMTDAQRQAISLRQKDKARGKYTISPEGLVSLQQAALNGGNLFKCKLDRLTPEQLRQRNNKRNALGHHLRKSRKAGDEARVAELKAQFDELDRSFGLEPETYKPRSYKVRPWAMLTSEDEQQFCQQFKGANFRIKDFQQKFQERFNRPISVSGAFGMIHRNDLKSTRQPLHLGHEAVVPLELPSLPPSMPPSPGCRADLDQSPGLVGQAP